MSGWKANADGTTDDIDLYINQHNADGTTFVTSPASSGRPCQRPATTTARTYYHSLKAVAAYAVTVERIAGTAILNIHSLPRRLSTFLARPLSERVTTNTSRILNRTSR